jgi:acyl-coenzyme A synthetase/AMP-(fatty) acid ligase
MISYFSSAVDVHDATDGESVAAAVCLGVGIAVADEATDALKSWCRKRRFPTLLVSVASE